jgi:hypothetical protein
MSSNNFNSEQQRTRESSRLNIMNIANNANNNNQTRRRICLINNNATIDRIARITTPQITSDPFENDFFNGASFHYDNRLESLILPTGFFS